MSNKLTIRNCRFNYKCTAKWNDLQDTEDDHVKFCDDCQKEVFFCGSDDELVAQVHLNRCVAILKPNAKGFSLGDVDYR